jgi:hypothetical protein
LIAYIIDTKTNTLIGQLEATEIKGNCAFFKSGEYTGKRYCNPETERFVTELTDDIIVPSNEPPQPEEPAEEPEEPTEQTIEI